MPRTRNLSNSFSTGGGGSHFEAHVQASFVTLMMSGGYAPCLPCWPIKEIKLQGKIEGYDTDDVIVTVENGNSGERRKLLGQVKHSISVTKSDVEFGEVIQAAWNDFSNKELFERGADILALITGPLSATDANNVLWLLEQARYTNGVDEFLRNATQAMFSPSRCEEKLEVFKHHLKKANDDNDVSNEDLYAFLKHFYLLSVDLGNESGVVLSLLHSHISQFREEYPEQVWARVVDYVQTCNQHAGTITPDSIPEDLMEAFQQRIVRRMPDGLGVEENISETDWSQHPYSYHIALAVLLGSWRDKNEHDLEIVSGLLGITYEEWIDEAREIIHYADSPLSLKNGVWKVRDRVGLWELLGSQILDQNLDTFKALSLAVLGEPDPALELPTEDRYMASAYGKVPEHSPELRRGISEGLAILGNYHDALTNCSRGKADEICILALRGLLIGADWVSWGSLNDLLPALAEANPNEFIGSVESAMRLSPCPFEELFSQENTGITGRNYLTGLLWALEALAWDDQYLVRVCVVLGELAHHDPGGQWANRPLNSLVSILLPWLPQTLASVEKREVAVKTIIAEWPDIAWKMLIQLLPDQHQISSGSYTPRWRNTIPADREERASRQEYWEQVSSYANLAVDLASQDVTRLSNLVEHFASLPEDVSNRLLEILGSQPVRELPEEQRQLIWDRLSNLINKHRRFSDATWAMSGERLDQIEEVANRLAPVDPFILHQRLFTNRDSDLFEENGDWDEQGKRVLELRDSAVSEIFQLGNIEEVVRFSEIVSSPYQVGFSLGVIEDNVIESTLVPDFLNYANDKHRELIEGFVTRRYCLEGWQWCDAIDRTGWTAEQTGIFLSLLPFIQDAWVRAANWLQGSEGEYWARTNANPYQSEGDLAGAVEKLITYGRPYAAVNCMYLMLHKKQPIDPEQATRALLEGISSNEPDYAMDRFHIVEVIKYLQEEPSTKAEELFKVEWTYLPLLNGSEGSKPQLLEDALANDPEFFCEIIRSVYRPKGEERPTDESSEETKAIATNAWHLLHEWKTIPGIQKDGTFNGERFTEWLQTVKALSAESGHLEVALLSIGHVLLYAPPDEDGLWICRTVASALNDRDADDMRRGFSTGLFNSRGVHSVDPSGKSERDIAKGYRLKAEEAENAGYQRLAITLRDLADSYDQSAGWTIDNNEDE